MDEILYRSSQSLESIQIRMGLAAGKAKDVLNLYGEQGRSLLIQAWNSGRVDHLKHNFKEIVALLLQMAREAKAKIILMADPQKLYMSLAAVFWRKWTKRDACFACAGFLVGGFVGIAIGMSLRKKEFPPRYMQAVQVNSYMGVESATVVEDAIAPYECGDYDVLVNVKAASVHIIDVQICSGYGRTFRKILWKLYNNSKSDLPVILGRDCTGIITDIGAKVKRLDIGDEVWITVPFWAQGTLCQTVLVSENRVGRKPKNIGFEGACSIPYAGSIALSILNQANIDYSNARHKKVLVQGGCTPVGCVLLQLLRHWKCELTTTCYKRASPVAKALGASEILVISENDPTTEYGSSSNGLLKELELKGDTFDLIIITRQEPFNDELKGFCNESGKVVSTLPPPLSSDNYGFVMKTMLANYIRLRRFLENLLGLPMPDFSETHLCHVSLDKLAEYVEEGVLQTVVDKVFLPQDIDIALSHIQSPHSIGSTVVTFR